MRWWCLYREEREPKSAVIRSLHTQNLRSSHLYTRMTRQKRRASLIINGGLITEERGKRVREANICTPLQINKRNCLGNKPKLAPEKGTSRLSRWCVCRSTRERMSFVCISFFPAIASLSTARLAPAVWCARLNYAKTIRRRELYVWREHFAFVYTLLYCILSTVCVEHI